MHNSALLDIGGDLRRLKGAKGAADVLMQGFHMELVHPRDVKPTGVLLTWRTQHSLVWNTRFDALFAYSQIKA